MDLFSFLVLAKLIIKINPTFELLFILSDMFPEYSFTDYFGLSCWTPFKIYPTLNWVGYINLFSRNHSKTLQVQLIIDLSMS
jgi:hypothetical protein